MALAQKPSARAKHALGENFIKYLRHKFGLTAIEKLKSSHVCTYISHLYLVRNGSAASLSSNLSQLGGYWRAEQKTPWLNKQEEWEVKRVIQHYKHQDVRSINRKLPLTADVLVAIDANLDLSKDADLLLSTLLWLGNQGVLRGDEFVGRTKLKRKDLRFMVDGKSMQLYLARTKTVSSGGGVFVTLPDNTGPSAVKRLREYLSRKGTKVDPEELLFPHYCTTAWLRHQIKKQVKRLGLDPRRYANHSLRAGGATDLFVARVPYYIIKKVGRWQSDAAMIYYRDDEDVERAVRKGRERLIAARSR